MHPPRATFPQPIPGIATTADNDEKRAKVQRPQPTANQRPCAAASTIHTDPPWEATRLPPPGHNHQTANYAALIASRRRLGALAAVTTTWILIGRGNVAVDHLIRSRKQHSFTTCNLSVDVPHLQVHVHGHPWSSVAVDVPTDVDQGCSSVADFGRLSVCRQASDSGSGASRPVCLCGQDVIDLDARPIPAEQTRGKQRTDVEFVCCFFLSTGWSCRIGLIPMTLMLAACGCGPAPHCMVH
jgi:hypothetical protein